MDALSATTEKKILLSLSVALVASSRNLALMQRVTVILLAPRESIVLTHHQR